MKRSAWTWGTILALSLLIPACRNEEGTVMAKEGVIGGIGLTRLTVYDQRPAPDGLQSGSPHIHAITDEAYYVMSGSGKVELHDLRFGFRSIDLTPGRFIQFPPCTLHRLVNTGHLVILVVMGNAGLAEHGDARIYFGKAVDDKPAEYDRLVGLAQADGLEGALTRRDEAVRAYQSFVDLWTFDKVAYYRELERFITVQLGAAAAKRKEFGDAVQAGPGAWANRYRARVKNLPLNMDEMSPIFYFPSEETTFGMCGILQPVSNVATIK